MALRGWILAVFAVSGLMGRVLADPPAEVTIKGSVICNGACVAKPGEKASAGGLYDMVSSWWEITADRGMYNVRVSEVDPSYPPAKPEDPRSQRNGRGLLKDGWSIVTHEFITENSYAGQKFRVVIDDE